MAVLGVQRGNVTLGSGASSVAVTISSVVTAQSRIHRSYAAPETWGERVNIRAYFASATSLVFERAGSGAAIDIAWQVIEHDSSTSVQHVDITWGSSGVETAAISAVTLAQAFPEKRGLEDGSEHYGLFGNAEGAITLSSTTAVRAEFDTSSGSASPASGSVLSLSVVDSPDCAVQVVTGTSAPATISTVDPSAVETVMFARMEAQVFSGSLPWAEIASATSVDYLEASGLNVLAVHVIEWTDGTTVQRGALAVGGSGSASATTITSVDTDQAAVYSEALGTRHGVDTTSITGGYEGGYGHISLASATSVEAYRSGADSTSNARYQVVEYAAASVGSDVDAEASGSASSTGAATATVDSVTVDAEASGSASSTGAAAGAVDLAAEAEGSASSTANAEATIDSVIIDAEASGSATSTASASSQTTVEGEASGSATSTAAADATVGSVTVDAEATGSATSTASAEATVESATVDAEASGSSSSTAAAEGDIPGVNLASGSASSTGSAEATLDSVTVNAEAGGSSSSAGSAEATLDSVTVDAEASGSSSSTASAEADIGLPIDAAASGSSSSTASAEATVVTPPIVDAQAMGAGISLGRAAGQLLGDLAVRPTVGGSEMGSRANRARILSEVRWRMSQITRANGYGVEVRNVYPDMRSASEVGRENMPALCVFPGVGQQPTQYGAFNFRDEWLRVEILAHVAGDEHADRADLLSSLEASIIEELDKDTTRGGWATNTLRVAGGDSDEGSPEERGISDGTATMHTTIEAMYTPGTWSLKPMRYSEIYITTPAPTVVLAGSWSALAGAWAEGVGTPANTANTATGQITYRRERALTFEARALLQVLAPSGGLVSARFIVGGVALARTEMGVQIAAGEVGLLQLDSLLDVARDQAVGIQLSAATGQSLTAQRGILSLTPASLV